MIKFNLEEQHKIATFMKLYMDDDGYYKNSYDVMTYFPELNYTRSPDELCFHSDWNWIMRVTTKIETLGYTINILSKKDSCICMIRDSNIENPTIACFYYGSPGNEDTAKNKKECVYKAIVKFIDYYNKKYHNL